MPGQSARLNRKVDGRQHVPRREARPRSRVAVAHPSLGWRVSTSGRPKPPRSSGQLLAQFAARVEVLDAFAPVIPLTRLSLPSWK